MEVVLSDSNDVVASPCHTYKYIYVSIYICMYMNNLLHVYIYTHIYTHIYLYGSSRQLYTVFVVFKIM